MSQIYESYIQKVYTDMPLIVGLCLALICISLLQNIGTKDFLIHCWINVDHLFLDWESNKCLEIFQNVDWYHEFAIFELFAIYIFNII